MNIYGENRKNDAEVIADFLIRLHRRVEGAIEREAETIQDLDIVLEQTNKALSVVENIKRGIWREEQK